VLILFDIDMTLLTTNGAGPAALAEAGRALHGPEFRTDTIDYGGRIDPDIIGELLTVNGVEPTLEARSALRREYAERLPAAVAGKTRSMPGVPSLLAALAGEAEVTVGVLTGNFEETGCHKLQAAGLDLEGFRVRVWGDDSPLEPHSRDQLPGVALERYTALHARELDPAHAVVIGDTIHDIACARAHGLRALAVATGHQPADILERANPDLVLADLSNTQETLEWLLNP
jgi:phosphoglycolate phosphatase